MVPHRASRVGLVPEPPLSRAVAELLVGIDLALLLLHLAAGLPLLLRGVSGAAIAAALGTADSSLLGLMAPGQYAAAALLLAACARGRGSAGLWRAAAAAGLLALGDLLSLPALLGGAAAAALGLSPSLGLVPAQLGKLAVGGALAALLGALAGPPACSADPEPRAAGRILLLAALALAGIDLLLDLPGAWLGPGVMSGLMLDPLEELAEALTASAALVVLVRQLMPEQALMSHYKTIHRPAEAI